MAPDTERKSLREDDEVGFKIVSGVFFGIYSTYTVYRDTTLDCTHLVWVYTHWTETVGLGLRHIRLKHLT